MFPLDLAGENVLLVHEAADEKRNPLVQSRFIISVKYGSNYDITLFYDLHTDPKEEHPMEPRWIENGWVRWPVGLHLAEHVASLQREPPIRPGTPDPYVPAK
jgi:hypothetical protein